jgi:hypothetical protein
MCRPSRPSKGGARRHERGVGCGGRGRRRRGCMWRAGQWIEPSLVSHTQAALYERRLTLFSLMAKQEARVRRNRVVLAVVATVKLRGDARSPTG